MDKKQAELNRRLRKAEADAAHAMQMAVKKACRQAGNEQTHPLQDRFPVITSFPRACATSVDRRPEGGLWEGTEFDLDTGEVITMECYQVSNEGHCIIGWVTNEYGTDWHWNAYEFHHNEKYEEDEEEYLDEGKESSRDKAMSKAEEAMRAAGWNTTDYVNYVHKHR